MPTQFNSSIYAGDAPEVDAGSVMVLRKAGALIFGKTTTTEFAAHPVAHHRVQALRSATSKLPSVWALRPEVAQSAQAPTMVSMR
jgi:Asp-tRNA(Asn)/Glu-tRNA(Gln) amidotransferase A subunit family amidase